MKRELTEPEIEKLYAFTARKLVDTYDIQTELVDHLATDIEAQWAKDPDLSLDEALQKVYDGFGIFGFLDVYENRINAIKMENLKLWGSKLIGFFRWPKLVYSLFLFVLFEAAFSIVDRESVLIGALGLFLAVGVFLLIREIVYYRKNVKKKLAILRFGYGVAIVLYFPYYVYIFIFKHVSFESTWPYSLFLAITWILLLAFVSAFIKIKQRAMEQYPAAFA